MSRVKKQQRPTEQPGSTYAALSETRELRPEVSEITPAWRKYAGTEKRSLDARVERAESDIENRKVEFSFSSDTPIDRGFFIETLDHSPQAVRLGRLKARAAVLVNHDIDQHVGAVETVRLDGGKGRVGTLFSRNAQAQDILRDIEDDIRVNVSVGYVIHNAVEERTQKGEKPRIRVTDWEPLEITIASIPADIVPGQGRSFGTEDKPMDENANMNDMNVDDDAVISSPSVEEIATDATRSERNRVSEITAVAERFRDNKKIAYAARQAIEAGTAWESFLRDAMKLVSNNKPVIQTELGMDEREVQRYSLFNVLRGQIEQKEMGTPFSKTAPYEFELHRALMEKLDTERSDKVKGILVPWDVQQRGQWGQRAVPMDTTENVHLVSTDHLAGNFIDALRAASSVMAAGATTLPGLVGDVSIPKMGAVPFEWLAEDAAATTVEPSTASVTLSPTTMAGHVNITRRLLKQSSPAVEGLIRQNLSAGAGKEVDRVSLIGAVGAEPIGVIGLAASTVTITVGAPTWAQTVEFESTVEALDALLNPNAAAYIGHPTIKGSMKTTPKDAGSGQFIWEGNTVNGYRAFSSTNVGNPNRLIFGDFSQLLIGFWGVLDVMADPYTDADRGRLYVRAFQDMDVAVRHPQSFADSTII